MQNVFGIVGIISLAYDDYIIVISAREQRGNFMGHPVYEATNLQILPMSNENQSALPATESYLLGLVKAHLRNSFLLSYDWDITTRLQAQDKVTAEPRYLWELADDRFFWNKNLQSRFIDFARNSGSTEIGAFILPVMFGTFDIRTSYLKGRSVQLCLISRRSRFRAGTRYMRRGADSEGHVANFNETEQVLLVDRPGKSSGDLGIRLSFVQIRGSIPLFWAEINNLRYKPDLQVMDLPGSENAMKLHLQELVEIYGQQNLVSLVNQKGYEKPIKEAFEKYAQTMDLPTVKYDHFDFHHECRNMKWDRISELIERIQEDLIGDGYYHSEVGHSEPLKEQSGTVRTNCMDNLDRTNVAQSAIAKWMLDRQLRDIGIFEEGETIDSYERFMYMFRNMWADHADSISKAYSGTGALKTDYTRTGKRSKQGLLSDGLNSVQRYVTNNFFDGPRQDGYDLVTGNWNPRAGSAAARAIKFDTRPLLVRFMPSVVAWSLFMMCCGLTLPRSSAPMKYWMFIWGTLLAVALTFIFIHGIYYVSWPLLNPLTDVIHYDGPGFRSKTRGRGLGISGRSKSLLQYAPLSYREWVEKGHGRAKSRANEIEMGELAKKRLE